MAKAKKEKLVTLENVKWNSKDLPVILSEGESNKTEFKETADKSLASEVCAFANATGGRIFIGINDNGSIVGTDVSNSARSRIQDTISKIEPRLKVNIETFENIIVLTVPEGKQKPYSCPAGFYLRSGPNSQKLERNSIVEFFQTEGKIRYDEIVREDLPITKRFNKEAYQRFIKIAKISNVLKSDAILTNLNCAGYVNDKLCFTNAGALFFRKNDEDVLFRHAGVVCALYKGTDKAIILDAKELNGDIISNIDDAIVFLKKHLRISYKIEKLRRENILELPEDALREAVVNAVCHRDYFEKGARVMVEIFDDRVDIVNPGGVCKGITRENFGKISITRNSNIASLLHRIDYIEQMGTGIMRIKKAAKDAKVATPKFELNDFFRVTFNRDNSQSVTSDSQSAAKRSPSGRQAVAKRSEHPVKNDKKQAVILFLKKHDQVRAPELLSVLDLSDGRIRALLRDMVNDGTIEKIGNHRYAYYILKT